MYLLFGVLGAGGTRTQLLKLRLVHTGGDAFVTLYSRTQPTHLAITS